MSDLDRLTKDAATQAALAVGKDAAKRAMRDLLSDGEQPTSSPTDRGAAKDAAAASKSRRWKIVAVAVLGLFLFVGLIGLVLNYWAYFLGAGVLGLGALVAWWWLRRRLAEGKTGATAESKSSASAKTEAAETPREKLRVSDEPAADDEAAAEARRAALAARREELTMRAKALAEARAQQEQEVDEELAAMKARLKK
ncbi:MAG TPA: hypothetical protein VL400_02010 [Polyangiaceae bacterium]|nr:hypothetical protein [Polyangiaceae bacterium]